MGSIKINGTTYSGRTITIVNGKVIINEEIKGGKDVTPDGKEINILVEGGIDILTVDACNVVGVEGNVGEIKTMTIEVKINGNVSGNVKTMSGNVTCLEVYGKVETMSGDIKKN